ncbi:MAG TPA: GIY-YIG nuclease family protein, partial [Phycisphaerae bacterium]|nr:GIY-YIG nuclease family protein [Phycisphaerae bacterium]
PVSAITHVAGVASIEPYKSTGKYVVNFKSKARKLSHAVRPGSRRVGPQGPFFSRFRALRAARTLDDL